LLKARLPHVDIGSFVDGIYPGRLSLEGKVNLLGIGDERGLADLDGAFA
jgi:hypothetical protein